MRSVAIARAVALVVAVTGCGTLDSQVDESSLEAGGECRGSCTKITASYLDKDGKTQQYTTYRCVDYQYSAVHEDSHVHSTTGCNYVAKCYADGICGDHFDVAARPIGGAVSQTECRKDGDGTTWCNARPRSVAVGRYFLYPDGKPPTLQFPASYTLTEPPRDANPSVAIGGRHPCGIDKENARATLTCPTCDQGAVIEGFLSETQRCYSDAQLDPPRQYVHVSGAYPQNATMDRASEFNALACGLGLAGAVGSVGTFFVTDGNPAIAFAFLEATGALAGIASCIPGRAVERTVEKYFAGKTFATEAMGLDVAYKLSTPGHVWNYDLEGQVCSRTFVYKWVNTRVISFDSYSLGLPENGWSMVGSAESDARFASGGEVTATGTEPCRCRTNPNDESEIGLRCSTGKCLRWSSGGAGSGSGDGSGSGVGSGGGGASAAECLEWEPDGMVVSPPWVVTDKSTVGEACSDLGSCTGSGSGAGSGSGV